MARKDNQFYVSRVPIPRDLTPAEAEQFIEDLAKGLELADPQIKARTHSNYQKQDPQDADAVAPTATMQPLYFCHSK